MNKVIAIDGPAGSGKGTIAKLIAKRLGLTYIDTGATYRSIALATLKNNIKIDEKEKIINLTKTLVIDFDKDGKTYLNNQDVSKEIRTNEVNNIVSPISSIPEIRDLMVDLQRKMAKNKDVIMEGRDITTVVFPNAKFKFYLDADINERAKRRFLQNKQMNIESNIDEIIESIKKRDYNDMNKPKGALKRCEDQIYIDTTNMTIDEVVNKIVNYVEKGQ